MKPKYLILLIVSNVIFLVLGGVIFHLIENPPEKQAIEDSTENLEKLIEDIFGRYNTCLSEDELSQIIDRVIQEYDDGNIYVDGSPNWDISGSIFFATTVATTIGYGHISPATQGGRIFCIFYALLGIPLCLIMLGEIGIRLSHLGQHLDKRLNRGWFPKGGVYFRPVLISVVGFTLFVLIPAGIMTLFEKWSYGDAVYYCVITLTTVGFGDLVAGQNNDNTYRWTYQIGVCFWIMIGLSWVANLIANSQEIYRDFGEDIGEFVDEIFESSDEEDEKDTNKEQPIAIIQTNGDATITKL